MPNYFQAERKSDIMLFKDVITSNNSSNNSRKVPYLLQFGFDMNRLAKESDVRNSFDLIFCS
jgi:hypothetical protein